MSESMTDAAACAAAVNPAAVAGGATGLCRFAVTPEPMVMPTTMPIVYANLGFDLSFERRLLDKWHLCDGGTGDEAGGSNGVRHGDRRPRTGLYGVDIALEAVEGSRETVIRRINAVRSPGLVTALGHIDDEFLTRCPSLKVVSLESVGTDNVDIDAANRHGVLVCHVPGYCTQDVALHTLALALDLTRQITFHDRAAHKGRWDTFDGYPMNRIGGRTFGLVFFGSIARCLAGMLTALGFRVLVYAPTKSAEDLAGCGCDKADTLDQLLAESDYVSLHCPLIEGMTYHLIGEPELARMKSTAFLINTSRGPVVDEQALAHALEEGWIRAAAVDVLENPLDASPLANCDRCIITPHSAFLSQESFGALRTSSLANVIVGVAAAWGVALPDLMTTVDGASDADGVPTGAVGEATCCAVNAGVWNTGK